MALILKMDKGGIKARTGSHKKTDCSYFIDYDKAGKKILQLDRFGSEDRKMVGRTSQSLRFSPEAIQQLKELLLKEF